MGNCEVDGCKRKAIYALYKTFPNDIKVWLHVCREHEKEIGIENMRRAGGYYTKKRGYNADR